jgi:hypothetical protein
MIKAINVDLLDEKFSLYKEVTKLTKFKLVIIHWTICWGRKVRELTF